VVRRRGSIRGGVSERKRKRAATWARREDSCHGIHRLSVRRLRPDQTRRDTGRKYEGTLTRAEALNGKVTGLVLLLRRALRF